jgi:cell division protein ZapA
MAQLTVKINGYAYTVACEDGQEAHLQEMARQVEERIERLKALSGASGEGRMLVLAALLMADELHDTAIDMVNLRRQLSDPSGALAPATEAEPRDTKRIAKLARKAEDIAASIEQS